MLKFGLNILTAMGCLRYFFCLESKKNQPKKKNIMKYIISSLIVLASVNLFGQYKPVIFDSLKLYEYEAIFINSKGDTLTKEKILINSMNVPWEFQKSQNKLYYQYFPDSIGLKSFVNPVKKFRKLKYRDWNNFEETGVIENESSLWMHPFRANQYVYTQVAPFPNVQLENGKIIKEWSRTLFILHGWSTFKGIVKSNYSLGSIVNYSLNDQMLYNCFEINAEGVHNKLGVSYLKTIFNKEYGFLEMNYLFYDKTQIKIRLKNVSLK